MTYVEIIKGQNFNKTTLCALIDVTIIDEKKCPFCELSADVYLYVYVYVYVCIQNNTVINIIETRNLSLINYSFSS